MVALQRILILGSPGTGKSTLARSLQKHLQLPLYHLDQAFFRANWVESPDQLNHFLQTTLPTSTWIIDGNYHHTLPARLQQADTVILLDFPTRLALFGVLKRYLTHRNRTRPDMAAGCEERLSFSFLWYVLSFKHEKLGSTKRMIKEHPHLTYYHFKSRGEVKKFLAQLC